MNESPMHIPQDELPQRLEVATKKQERSRNQVIIVIVLLLIVASFTALRSVQALKTAQENSNAQQKASAEQQRVNGEKIDALTTALAASQDEVKSNQVKVVSDAAAVLAQLQEQDARNACSLKYVRATTTTFENENSIFFELVVIGFQTAPVGTPGSDRTDKINAVLVRLDAARVAHDKAVADAASYIDAGSPLPCPV